MLKSLEARGQRLSATIRASRKRFASLKDRLVNSFVNESTSWSGPPGAGRRGAQLRPLDVVEISDPEHSSDVESD